MAIQYSKCNLSILIKLLVFIFLSSCIDGSDKSVLKTIETEKSITLNSNNVSLITFHKSEMHEPVGKDSLYRRSGFIHPLKTLAGAALTQIHPADHEHHLGLWHPWTKTVYKGKEVDFWNLYRGEGYVRYDKTIQTSDNGFTALLKHALREENETILTDTFSVKLTQKTDSSYVLDYKSIQTCVADSPIMMQQYRYGGGLGLRLTKEWSGSKVEVLTSENTGRNNTDATSAYWLKLKGKYPNGDYAGVVIIPHKSNFSYPEQIRLWGEKMYPGGDFMVNISPTKKEPLTMIPGRSYEFNYRLIIFDGDISQTVIADEMEKYNTEK